MKSTVRWGNKAFSVGMIVFLMSFIIGCGSGGWGDPSPVGVAPFNTSCLPLTVTNSDGGYGSFTFDADGNLLFVVNDEDEIRLLNRNTCTVTTVATEVSGVFRLGGMTYDQGSIFVGDGNGNIRQVDPTNGSSTLLATISSDEINGIVIAPATYGSYGGQLIVAAHSGNIYAVNQTVASPTPELIANVGEASALIFGSDGTLYVVNYDNSKIVTVSAAGAVVDFVTTGLSGPDGLAINSNGDLLYITDSGDGTLKSVTIPGGVVSTITSVNFNNGWCPSPIIYDATSNILLMGTNESGKLTIVNYNF